MLVVKRFNVIAGKAQVAPPEQDDGPPAQVLVLEVPPERRPVYPLSVLAPSEVSTGLVAVLQSLALTVLLVLLVGFPAELFNKTLEENYTEIRGWFQRLHALAVPQLRLSPRVQFIGFAVIGVLLTVLAQVQVTDVLSPETPRCCSGCLLRFPSRPWSTPRRVKSTVVSSLGLPAACCRFCHSHWSPQRSAR